MASKAFISILLTSIFRLATLDPRKVASEIFTPQTPSPQDRGLDVAPCAFTALHLQWPQGRSPGPHGRSAFTCMASQAFTCSGLTGLHLLHLEMASRAFHRPLHDAYNARGQLVWIKAKRRRALLRPHGSWAQARRANHKVFSRPCITRPRFPDLVFERSPPPRSGSPSPNWATCDHPHPLNSLRSRQELKPCLSAGFRDIKKQQLPNNPPHVQSDWNVQNQANPLCQKTIHPSLSLMLLTNLTTIGEMAQKLTRFHLPMVLQECGKK